MSMLESLLIPVAILLALTGFDRLPTGMRDRAWLRLFGGFLLGAAAVWFVFGEPSIASRQDGVLFTSMVVGASLGVRILFELTRQTIAGRQIRDSVTHR